MSYEIVYKRFLVKTEDNKLIPYFIWGSNNCYEYSGKRERNTFNLFGWDYYKDIPQDNLKEFLSILFDKLQGSINDGLITKLPKTKKSFIGGFFKYIIEEEELLLNGEQMEDRLNYMFKSEKKQIKSDFDILKEIEHKPLIDISKAKDHLNKTIFVFDRYENPQYKGKFKKVYCGEIGFFKSRSKKRYYYLSNFKYFKQVVYIV